MGAFCAVVRMDELEDAGSSTKNVKSMLDAGLRFLDPKAFFEAGGSGEFGTDLAALLVVHAYSYEYLRQNSRRLASLGVPFLPVCNSKTLKQGAVNWVVHVNDIVARAPEGDYEVMFGPGLVKYCLQKGARKQAVQDIVRRLAVLEPSKREKYIDALEIQLCPEQNVRVADLQAKDAGPQITSELLSACAVLPEPIVSKLVSSELFDDGLGVAREGIRTLGQGCLQSTAAMPFRHDYWKGRNGASHDQVVFAYSYQQLLCSAQDIKDGAIPQVEIPVSETAVLEIKQRLKRSQRSALPSGRSCAHYYGGKRALLKSFSASFLGVIGSYRTYTEIDFTKIRRVVFFCKGNINRSAYAACSFRSKSGLAVVSFGLSANDCDAASVPALERALRDGLDLTDHVTTSKASFVPLDGDLFVAFEPDHIRICQSEMKIDARIIQFTLAGLWSYPRSPYIQDPIVRSEAYYERCFDIISSSVEHLADCLKSTPGQVA